MDHKTEGPSPKQTPFDKVEEAQIAVKNLRDRIDTIVDVLAGVGPDGSSDGSGANPVVQGKLHQIEHSADAIIANASDASRTLDRLSRLIGKPC